jgi:hypothetical protein
MRALASGEASKALVSAAPSRFLTPVVTVVTTLLIATSNIQRNTTSPTIIKAMRIAKPHSP